MTKTPTATTGAVHELLVATDLLQRGHHVFRAVSPACPFDLVALIDGRLLRVEVTTGCRYKRGLGWPPKDPTKFDLLAVVLDGVISYMNPKGQPQELV